MWTTSTSARKTRSTEKRGHFTSSPIMRPSPTGSSSMRPAAIRSVAFTPLCCLVQVVSRIRLQHTSLYICITDGPKEKIKPWPCQFFMTSSAHCIIQNHLRIFSQTNEQTRLHSEKQLLGCWMTASTPLLMFVPSLISSLLRLQRKPCYDWHWVCRLLSWPISVWIIQSPSHSAKPRSNADLKPACLPSSPDPTVQYMLYS